MKTPGLACLIGISLATAAPAQTATRYHCKTDGDSFRYVLNTRSTTIQFNGGAVLPFTRSNDRSEAERRQYNVILDEIVEIQQPQYQAPTQFSFSLFLSDDGRPYLTENFSDGLFDPVALAASDEEIAQAAGAVPCMGGKI